MDEATLNQELFDTLGNRMSFPEIQAITRELAEIDGKRGHVSMDTLHNYLRFNPSKDGTKRHRDQMPSIIDSIRKRMSALHKKNQLSFNNLNKNSTFISDGELHKWVLQQPSLAYDLGHGDVEAHETAPITKFSYGVANRGCSVRIPRMTEKEKCGYFEDRRPASNMDPYIVTGKIMETTVLPDC
mgnify:CR=1 FL=1